MHAIRDRPRQEDQIDIPHRALCAVCAAVGHFAATVAPDKAYVRKCADMQQTSLRFQAYLFLSFGAIVLTPWPVHASSSGLNNIPTAETAGNLKLVFQGYSTFGVSQGPNDVVAFKFGIDPWETSRWRNRFELGVDSRYAPDDAGPGMFQFKYTTQPDPKLPAICIGVANLGMTAMERVRTGQPFSYAVITQDFRLLRLHGGYALQANHSNTALLGVDKAVKVAGHDVMFRADAIQINRQHDWAASFGGISSIGKHFAFEAWVTQPVNGHKANFTVKLNYILHL